MDITPVERRTLYRSFPLLKKSNFKKTSEIDGYYNCIAWALGFNNKWWWPSAKGYWPQDCLKEETILAFEEAFSFLGYEQCNNGNLEKGFDKIALYAIGSSPTHAARQLKNGQWTSKLGENIDIRHDLVGLESEVYGKVVKYFSPLTDISWFLWCVSTYKLIGVGVYFLPALATYFFRVRIDFTCVSLHVAPE